MPALKFHDVIAPFAPSLTLVSRLALAAAMSGAAIAVASPLISV